MTFFVPLADILAFVLGLWLFRRLSPLGAMLAVLIGGWLLLPAVDLAPNAWLGPTKLVVIEVTILVGTIWFGLKKGVVRPRFAWWDLGILGWIGVAFVSEMSNRLGALQAFREMSRQFFVWGLPYLIGRIYLTDFEALREMGVALVLAALAVIPLALFDTLFHPTLYERVYGVAPLKVDPLYHLIANRWGPTSWRPGLALVDGALELAFFYAAAATLMCGLVWTRRRNKWLWAAAGVLVLMPVVCKVFMGIGLMAVGIAALGLTAMMNRKWPILLLVAVPFLYAAGRTTQVVGFGENSWVRLPFTYSQDEKEYLGKSYSLWQRFLQEDVIFEMMKQRPRLGFGSQVKREWHQTGVARLDCVDGIWDFALVRYGWVGLGLLAWVWAVPLLVLIWRMPRSAAKDASLVAVAGLAVVVALHGWDALLNTSISPIWIACLGGMAMARDGTAGGKGNKENEESSARERRKEAAAG